MPADPITLVMETTGPACSAALMEGATLLDERHELVGRGHAERLVPMVAELLGGRRPSAILVDCGPGSFTGIRVGLAAAHGMRLGWGVPLAGFSSTSLVAAAAGGGEIAVALEGGHGQLFVQSFADDPLRPLDALRSLTPAGAARVIEAARIAGSGAAALIAERGHGEAVESEVRAADARRLPPALRSLRPVPIYGRAPDARPRP